MKKYELVAVIDANLSAGEITGVKESIEKLLDGGILETDNIGLVQMAYPLEGQEQAYLVSYYVEIDSDTVDELKNELKLIKGLAKSPLFAMGKHESFLKMSELTKRFEDMTPEEETPEEPAAEKETE